MRYRPRFESLESRDACSASSLTPAVRIGVGPGQLYATPDQVPWASLQPGTEVDIQWQAAPYHSKIDLTASGTRDAPILIQGIPGPNGQLPQLDAANAIENADASYFSSQIMDQGVFTIAPSSTAGFTDEVHDIVISGLELTGATRDATFTAYDGSAQWYNWGAAGVAMYRAEHITVQGCRIHGDEDGIFGKSYGYAGGDLAYIVVSDNHLWGNGVVGADHYHNTYLEGWYTLYSANTYGPLLDGALGVALKDRSLSPTIAFNYLSGGTAQLDLVDPDDGAADMVGDPAYGNVYVYGNVLVDTETAGHLVHFGFDQVATDSQRTLYFYDNTVVNENSYPGGHYYTELLKLNGGTTAYVFDNAISIWSPENEWPGNFYLAVTEYGDASLVLGVNVVPVGTFDGSDSGALVSGDQNLIYSDPGFVDLAGGDYRLRPDSPAIGIARGLYYDGQFWTVSDVNLPAVNWQWSPAGWLERESTNNLGAAETSLS